MRDAYGIHDAEFFGTENGMRRKQQFTESIEGKAMRGNIRKRLTYHTLSGSSALCYALEGAFT
jgi:hypothetical protein